MLITPKTVEKEHKWVCDRCDIIVPLINDVRSNLGDIFETSVDTVTPIQYTAAADEVFSEGAVAVNIAALIKLLRELDVQDDYPGFVIDEFLGRELAGIIAGNQPFRLLAEATFHYADLQTHYDSGPAGLDDLDAAIAAGFQTRLPGWNWTEQKSPFSVTHT